VADNSRARRGRDGRWGGRCIGFLRPWRGA